MGTIGDKLNYLAETKNQMKTALKSKGQDIKDNDSFRSYVGKINNLSPTPTGTINISQNGTYDVSNYANADVDVAGEPTLQSKSVTIAENGTQTITPDIGYDGLNEVEITTNVSSDYFNPLSEGSTYIPGILSAIKTIPSNMIISGTSLLYAFTFCKNLENVPVLDTSNVQNMGYAFQWCSKLKTFPLWNTENVFSFYGTFWGCRLLENVPVLNTSSVTNFTNMFNQCYALSNESLNNIMQMCINATSYTETKTLDQLGLTQAQATTCQTLSNWNDFVAAGWSTGY